MRNLITDVPGIRVGNAHGAAVASGVTVALFDRPAITGVVVPGGAPGGRETALLEPEMTVEAVDAVVLSGGSTLGLDAATGVQIWLRERGRGFPIGTVRVPIVTQAICFDLLNGGAKDWGAAPPYRDWATEACEAAGDTFALGSVGGGYGATTLDLKGGLGSASALAPSGHVVGALAVVNAIGSAAVGGGPHFWAGPWEVDAEFGGLGPKPRLVPGDLALGWKGSPPGDAQVAGTTIALVATDAVLTPAGAKRLAIMASAGLPRALRLAFAPLDGDTVFASATGERPLRDGVRDLTGIGATAADCLARAIARGVHAATALPFPGALPAWRDRFGVSRP